MALLTNLDTLDYQHGGMPFMRWASVALADTETLDYQHGALPFYSQFDTQALFPAVVTLSAQDTEIHATRRRFPNKRQEMIGETQIKHVAPALGAQYTIYLP